MPIRIADGLPAKQELLREGIQVMEEQTAQRQDIRPLKILLLNLMPKKEETELQFLRLLGSQPLQIEVDFLQMSSRKSSHTNASHLEKFYYQFNQIQDRYYDGLIVTGAPVEHLDFEDVTYWQELQRIFDWSKSHVFSCLHICWGAQARLYTDYGITKHSLPIKLFGIFSHDLTQRHHPLTRGMDDSFLAPQSRHTGIDEARLAQHPELDVLATAPETGTLLAASKDNRQIFVTGHMEYDALTLDQEYRRDLGSNPQVCLPLNYYPQDQADLPPQHRWRSSAYLFFHNWLNLVYQQTPYDLTTLDDQSTK